LAASILERTERIAQARELELPGDTRKMKSPAPASTPPMGVLRPIAWGAIATGVLLITGGKFAALMNADVARWLEPFAGWGTEVTPLWQMVGMVAAGVILLSAGFLSPKEE
jgi:hypothetical protein